MNIRLSARGHSQSLSELLCRVLHLIMKASWAKSRQSLTARALARICASDQPQISACFSVFYKDIYYAAQALLNIHIISLFFYQITRQQIGWMTDIL